MTTLLQQGCSANWYAITALAKELLKRKGMTGLKMQATLDVHLRGKSASGDFIQVIPLSKLSKLLFAPESPKSYIFLTAFSTGASVGIQDSY